MKVSQLKAGVVLSYINMLIGILIPFFYTPVMLKLLGQAEYGLYSLSNSIISYASILSLGFGTTIIRYIAKFRAEKDIRNLEGTYGFFLEVYSALALVVLIGGFYFSGHLDQFFHRGLSSAELSKMRYLLIIMTVNAALSFPHSVFSAMIIAHERFIFRRFMDILVTLVVPVFNLIALYSGLMSIGMALVSTCVQVVMLPVNWWYCFQKLKIHPRFRAIPQTLIIEMMNISIYNFMGAIVDMLFWATGKVMLGMLASTVAVAVYNIGCTFNSMVISFSTCMSSVLTPRITQMVSYDSDCKELSDLFIRVGRLQFIIIGLVISGFIIFGRSFIFLWVGKEYLEAYWIAILTLIPLSIPLIQNTGINIIVAQNRQKFRAILYLMIAVINVVITYFVIPYYGVIGAAFCSGISFILGQGVIMNIYYSRIIHLEIGRFWRNISRLGWFPIVWGVFSFYVKQYITMNNWGTFFVGCCVYAIVYIIGLFICGLNCYEKKLVLQPIKSLLNNF